VIADWPGLAQSALYQGRDLKPTLDLDGLIAGAAAETLSLDPTRVRSTLFASAQQGIVKVTVNTVFQRILADYLLMIFHDFFGAEVVRSGADSRFTQLP
jgi:hypothetical protein